MFDGVILNMRHENTLDAARTALVIIDMQDAFRSSISYFADMAARIALMAHAAQMLNVPVIVTEQYPKGLGRTADVIRAVLPASQEIFEKTAFSSCGARNFNDLLGALETRQVIVCGVEAHVCVNQTTHDLLARGLQVHLLTDCIAARAAQNTEIALAKMQQSGALPSSTEMALFELMRGSDHKHFKTIQKLIK